MPGGVLATFVALILAACGSSHGPPTPSLRPNHDLESIFEADPQLHTDPNGTLNTLRALGVNTIKLYVAWRNIAPDPDSSRPPAFDAASPAAYPAANWAPYDAIARAAAAHGIGVDLTIGPPPPLWAAGKGAPPSAYPAEWEPSASAFGAFVHAIGQRYGGSYTPPGASSPLPHIGTWAMWNEPNYGPDLAPQAIHHSTVEVSPRSYRALVDAAWSALMATDHRHDRILIGELAPRGLTVGDNPGNFSGMVPLRFVRALYCVDASLRPLRGQAATARGCPATAAGSAAFPKQHPALFESAGFSVHPYPQGRIPPTQLTPFEPDYADFPSLPRLESLLDRVQQAYGSSKRFPLYSTEFGYHTDPPEQTAKSAPVAIAAYYMNWAEYLSWRDPRVRSYDQYLLADPANANALGGFATGLEFSNGTPKPTLIAFRFPIFLPITRASKGKALEVWGCARPAYFAARDTGRAQNVAIEFADGQSGPYRVLDRVRLTDPHGYFDTAVTFPSSGFVRLSWSYPDGRVIHSRIVAVMIG